MSAVKPPQPAVGRSQSAARVDGGDQGHADIQLEDALERTNLQRALHRVERNGGAPGIDGMTTAELRPYLREHWPALARALLSGTYQPQPVRRVEIPKPGGGTRPLGIEAVRDRFLQQALLQALQPSFERIFAEQSYGFRPKRSAHQAVRAAQALVREGYGYAVDLDIAKFFDRVNHDLLMGRVAERIKDPRILLLVRRYLEAGVLCEGLKVQAVEGTPQGGPLSPLLANILLTDLDQELARRGHRFVRYADDRNVYVRSRRAGERVMAGLRRFLATRLRLQVNEAKSAVDRATTRPFLGFAFLGGEAAKLRLDPESLRRVRATIRTLTSGRKASPWRSASAGSTGISSAGSRISPWPKRRARSRSWRVGCDDDYASVAGKNGSGDTRERATCLGSVSPRAPRERDSRAKDRGGWQAVPSFPRPSTAGTGKTRVSSASLNATRCSGTPDEPPDADPHVRWCERRGGRPLLLLGFCLYVRRHPRPR